MMRTSGVDIFLALCLVISSCVASPGSEVSEYNAGKVLIQSGSKEINTYDTLVRTKRQIPGRHCIYIAGVVAICRRKRKRLSSSSEISDPEPGPEPGPDPGPEPIPAIPIIPSTRPPPVQPGTSWKPVFPTSTPAIGKLTVPPTVQRTSNRPTPVRPTNVPPTHPRVETTPIRIHVHGSSTRRGQPGNPNTSPGYVGTPSRTTPINWNRFVSTPFVGRETTSTTPSSVTTPRPRFTSKRVDIITPPREREGSSRPPPRPFTPPRYPTRKPAISPPVNVPTKRITESTTRRSDISSSEIPSSTHEPPPAPVPISGTDIILMYVVPTVLGVVVILFIIGVGAYLCRGKKKGRTTKTPTKKVPLAKGGKTIKVSDEDFDPGVVIDVTLPPTTTFAVDNKGYDTINKYAKQILPSHEKQAGLSELSVHGYASSVKSIDSRKKQPKPASGPYEEILYGKGSTKSKKKSIR